MAVATRTWAFLGNAEGLADLGDDAALSVQWSSTDGNPAGSLEFLQNTGSGSAGGERARKPTTDSWEALFGIPPGSTVTDVVVAGWDMLRWAITNIANHRWRIRLVDATGTSVHSAGDLVDLTDTSLHDGGVAHAQGPGPSRMVDGAYQASATGVGLEVQVSIVTTSTPNFDAEVDNITVTVVYTPPATSMEDPEFVYPPIWA